MGKMPGSQGVPARNRMTVKDLPKELLKIKGREPLPQIYPNHINNMATKIHAGPSFKNSKETSQKVESNTGPFLFLGLIFLGSLVAMAFVYWSFPKLRPEDKARIKLPRDMEDAKGLGTALSNYNDEYFTQVLLGFVIIYIFLQTFAIPGSIFLSILSGYLFPFPLALFLVCLVSGL